MPRYEFSEGSSNKFWEIALAGKSFTTTYGKIGANGQTTIKTFGSDADAKKEYEKLIAEKVKKGYEPANGKGNGNGNGTSPVAAAKPAAKPAPKPPKSEGAPGTASRPGARYFEFIEGTSSKFWEIAVDNTTVRTRYGKIGASGQLTIKELDSKGEAFKELDRLIAEKTRKGYEEKGATGATGAAAAKGDPRDAALEKAIVADPYDVDAYSVYADWLQDQGDPRGELITLQLAGKAKAAKALIESQAEYFLGPLVDHTTCYDDLGNNNRSNSKAWIDEHHQAFIWKFGFIHRARLAHDSYANSEFEGTLAQVLELLLRHPSGRFLTELAFNSNGDPNEDDLQDLLDILAKKAPPTIRKIEIGDNVDQISWYNVGNLGKVWKAVPNLTTLDIEAGSFTLGTIDAPNLRHAVFKTGGLTKASGKSIAAASWPKIEHLDVYYGDDNYGGNCSVKEVAPLLARTDLKSLTHLGLMNSSFSDELCNVLGTARILKQLKELDLSLGCMTDAGAAALVEHKNAFTHLDVLDVSQNYLTTAGVKTLKGIAKKVVSASQRDDEDPEYRHPRISE